MSNTFLNSQIIARELLLQFKNNLVVTKKCDRQYDKEFGRQGKKIGDTANYKRRQRFVAKSGQVLDVQPLVDKVFNMKVDRYQHVAFSIPSAAMTLNVERFSEEYAKPAGLALANKVDADICEAVRLQAQNSVGTPGTAPSTSAAALKLALQAGQKLDENSCPGGQRSIILNPEAQVEFVGGLSGLTESSKQIASQYEKGKMTTAAGFDWYMDQNIAMHTVGKLGGAPAIKTTIVAQGAKQVDFDGASNNISGFMVPGDVFTIAGVYAKNPLSGVVSRSLRQFTVTETVNSDGGGEGVIKFLPEIVTEGAYANCSALPVDGGVIQTFGHASSYAEKVSPACFAFHESAIGLAVVDQELPGGTDKAAMAIDEDSGLAIRFIRDYDIVNNLFLSRVDIMYGIGLPYPEWISKVHI